LSIAVGEKYFVVAAQRTSDSGRSTISLETSSGLQDEQSKCQLVCSELITRNGVSILLTSLVLQLRHPLLCRRYLGDSPSSYPTAVAEIPEGFDCAKQQARWSVKFENIESER
jgi:hypothetical protein